MTDQWTGDAEAHRSLDPLRARFPGWRFWVGSVTGNVWAMPPAGHPHKTLVFADDADALAAKVAEIEQRRESP
ncbi:MAG: hypothetical protein ACM3ML_02795 [Micromonosporaceae bacterium]